MSIEELNALLELASRAPKTGTEALWLAGFVQRIKDAVPVEGAQRPGSSPNNESVEGADSLSLLSAEQVRANGETVE